MRKILIAILALVTSAAQAQVGFGVRAGLGLNKVSAMELPVGKMSFDNTVGPMVGAMVSVETCSWLSLQMELNYAMRGYKSDILIDDVSMIEDIYKVRSSYLEVPLLLKVYPIASLGLNIQAGPQVGVLLGRSASANSKKVDTELLMGTNRNSDAAVVFGLGYDYYNWCFDVRYTLGLLDSYKDWNGYKNRGISLSVGYFFK